MSDVDTRKAVSLLGVHPNTLRSGRMTVGWSTSAVLVVGGFPMLRRSCENQLALPLCSKRESVADAYRANQAVWHTRKVENKKAELHFRSRKCPIQSLSLCNVAWNKDRFLSTQSWANPLIPSYSRSAKGWAVGCSQWPVLCDRAIFKSTARSREPRARRGTRSGYSFFSDVLCRRWIKI